MSTFTRSQTAAIRAAKPECGRRRTWTVPDGTVGSGDRGHNNKVTLPPPGAIHAAARFGGAHGQTQLCPRCGAPTERDGVWVQCLACGTLTEQGTTHTVVVLEMDAYGEMAIIRGRGAPLPRRGAECADPRAPSGGVRIFLPMALAEIHDAASGF